MSISTTSNVNTFQPTAEHLAIFDWVTSTSPATMAALIEAVAGSGKTSTLIQILRLIPVTQTVIFLAFNRDAAAEVCNRARAAGLDRPGLAYLTLNSFGFRALLRAFRGVQIDEDVVDRRLRDKLEDTEYRLLGSTVSRLISAAKSQGLVPDGIGATVENGRALLADTHANWLALADRFDIEGPGADEAKALDRAIEIARKALLAGLRDMSTIDFDDQLYAVLAHGVAMPTFDWVLVDEAQDLNPVQRHLLRRALKPRSRLIAVGDRHQAIYGFRGADSASLGMIETEYRAQRFALSVTYRCPRAVVALAQEYVPHLTAAASAPEGVVSVADVSKVAWRADDMVLCRTNAPLIRLAYQLIRNKVPCRVAGRDIGKGLTALVDRLKPRDLADLGAKLSAYKARESDKLVKAGAKEAKLQALADKVETLAVFVDEADTLQGMLAMIADLFGDKDTGRTTLSSVHKAKGQERPRVFILNRHLMPSRMAKSAAAMEQEKNLIYVALTRAKAELVFITIGDAPTAAAKPTPAIRR